MKLRVDRQRGWQYILPALLLLAGLLMLSSLAPTGKVASASKPQVAHDTPLDSNLLVSHVTWQGIQQPNNSNTTQTITLRLQPVGGGQSYDYTDLTTDANGYFTVDVSVLADGDYNYWAKGPRNLANGGTATLTGAPVTNLEIGLMKAGDANNDNAVGVVDFSIVKNASGRCPFSWCNYDPRPDFNNNDVVNSVDFNLLKINYGHGGAPLIGP